MNFMNSSNVQNNFSQGSMSRNILSMAVPITLAQLVNILYNITDRVYIGHISGSGQLELAGLGLCMPIITLILGFANLCGTGGGSLCSIHRGEGNLAEASGVLGNSFTLLLIFGFTIPLAFLPVLRPLLYFFGASDATFSYARSYLSIYLLGTPFVMISLGMNPMINSQGFGKRGMMTVLLGACVNLTLDPILIYGFGLGIQGAAWATVVAQASSAVWVLVFLTGKKATIRLQLRQMRLRKQRVRRIVGLGLAGFFTNLTNSLVQVVCNKMLQLTGGDMYVSIMTVINSIREVVFMVVQGLNNGAQPVLGYNYGAGCSKRLCTGIRFTVAVTVGYSCIVWLITMLFPGALMHLFTSDEALIQAGIQCMRIYFSMYVVMSLMISGQSVFVSIGKSKSSIFFSLLRKAIINAPLTVILALVMGTTGVFVAEAASQLVGGCACFLTMYFTVYRPVNRESRLQE